MKRKHTAAIAIIGAGIVGLAHAYMALRKGYTVVLFDRDEYAIGASVRNFGLIWPVGQLPGVGLNRAMRSRQHWLTISKEAGIWLTTNGSMHLAYTNDELSVLEEFLHLHNEAGYSVRLLTPAEVIAMAPLVNKSGLKGGMFSNTECTVYSRQVIRRIPLWLREKYGLILRFGKQVKDIAFPEVFTDEECWRVDHVLICSGTDFQTLYPQLFDKQHITKCKLQMMRAEFIHQTKALGPSLCSGLTLRHYPAFSQCPSLSLLDARYDRENSDFKKYGIHVLVAQNAEGELIIGDSHEYATTHDPFDSEHINKLIWDYLSRFVHTDNLRVTERWHGIYPKLLNGALDMVVKPEAGVTVINGLGGAGMTLSFGLAEEVVDKL
ncbi:MAG: TIGR03364 family FAD-dependent oxidoreductase [Cyclobacteriaceae bacterium]